MYFSQRTMIAGELPNTPENVERWIENPKAVEPKTAMPDLGLSPEQASDIAAYLYTLRGPEGKQWTD
jgi:cytochrome c1